jgi:hypothetical protein
MPFEYYWKPTGVQYRDYQRINENWVVTNFSDAKMQLESHVFGNQRGVAVMVLNFSQWEVFSSTNCDEWTSGINNGSQSCQCR